LAMGGCSSNDKDKGKDQGASAPVEAQVVDGGGGGGGGGGRGHKRVNKDSKFQWKDGSGWSDYDKGTDAKLKQALLVGRPTAKFKVKTHDGKLEEYSFKFITGHMSQTNIKTSKPRDIRPPYQMSAPKEPLLPACDFVVITLTADQVGKDTIDVKNPQTGEMFKAAIPKKAKKGQKIAVPIASGGYTMEDVIKKQEAQQKGMTTGAKVATGTAVVGLAGVGVVGGVILGDHLAGGDMAEQAVDLAEDAGEAIVDFAEDAGEVIVDFAEDVGDWLGDAAEDVGDWVCSVFD